MSNLFDSLPGSDLLRQALDFGNLSKPQPAPADNTRTAKSIPPKKGGGGGGGRGGSGGGGKPKSASDDKAWDEGPAILGEHNPEPVDDPVEDKPKASLKKQGWVQDKTLFKTEAEIFAEYTVPESEKHRTLVEFQLLIQEKGEFKVVETAKGHADAQGRATVKVPIRKTADKATFALKAKHCTADWSKPNGTEREVTETGEDAYAHTQVSGLHFTKNKSFIAPQYLGVFRNLETEFKSWRAEHETAKIVVYGHAERDEEDPRKLSARRSQAAFAFLIGDYHMWSRIANEERWGLWEQQHMLKAMGFYESKVDGIHGPGTKKAIRDFITWLNENEGTNFNPLLGFTEEYIRVELYRVYITGEKRKVQLPSTHFRLVSGNPYVGCGAFNRYKGGEESYPENRRATFLLIADSASFPVTFPCRSSSGPCESECQKAGERVVKGFGCKFYDELMQKEKVGEGVDEAKKTVLKKGDSGDAVKELNIRLAGFGGGVPRNTFDEQTESNVKHFQADFIGMKHSSGIVDMETAKAIDDFSSKFPIDIDSIKCKCGECSGFGLTYPKNRGIYSNNEKNEKRHIYEYPGVHRSLLWSIKGLQFYASKMSPEMSLVINSGYRCSEHSEYKKKPTENHKGKACDLHVYAKNATGKFLRLSENKKKHSNEIRSLAVKKMKAQTDWIHSDKFTLEPESIAPTWVHLDVRMFSGKFLEDSLFSKTTDSIEGPTFTSFLEG